MITEDYVSFETAKLLKEKGFDEPCNSFYEYKKRLYIHDMDEYFPNGMKNSDHDKENNKGISAPTLQMAMKWLREEKNIILDICPNLDLDCMCIGTYCRIVYKDNERVTLDADYDDFATYEEAVEEAIKYCLENLI